MATTIYTRNELQQEVRAAVRLCPEAHRHSEHKRDRARTVSGVTWALRINDAGTVSLLVAGYCNLCTAAVSTSVAI